MYRKKGRSWTKHIDFMLLDVLCMQIAFIVSYICRFGLNNPYIDKDYRILAVLGKWRQLLRMMDKFNEDGYQIVQDYMDSLSEVQRKNCDSEINRNKGNIYCGDIVDKYDGAYPIWAFIEIIPFGRLVAFYGFCADRFADKEMKNNFYRLLTCKEIRNASAHSNCILNDLKARTAAHKTNTAVTNELMMINDMNSNFRRNRMSNARIQQLVTLFYMHRTMVESDGIKKSESEEIQKVMKRIDRNYDYYSTNPMIKGTFDFLKMVVDNWFKTV